MQSRYIFYQFLGTIQTNFALHASNNFQKSLSATTLSWSYQVDKVQGQRGERPFVNGGCERKTVKYYRIEICNFIDSANILPLAKILITYLFGMNYFDIFV